MGTFPWCNAILALLLPRPLAHLWNDELVFLFIFYLLELNNFELKDFSWLWVIYNTHIQYIDLQMFDCLCYGYICYIYIVFISSVLLSVCLYYVYPSLCLLHFPTLICLSVLLSHKTDILICFIVYVYVYILCMYILCIIIKKHCLTLVLFVVCSVLLKKCKMIS